MIKYFRLRNANALIYGMSLLGAEVAKNLMLCGLKKLTIADEVVAKEPHFLMEYKPEVNENVSCVSKNNLILKLFITACISE